MSVTEIFLTTGPTSYIEPIICKKILKNETLDRKYSKGNCKVHPITCNEGPDGE